MSATEEGVFEMAQGDGFDAAVDAAVAAAAAPAKPEPTSEVVEPPAEAEAEAESTERKRNPDGTFAKEEPDPADFEFTPPEPEPTLEELQARLDAAEQRLADKDAFIGRQSNEVSELRQIADEIRQAQQQTAQPAPDPDTLADVIAASPAAAQTYAAQALARADWDTYDTVMDAWQDVDPRAARRYERQVNVWIAQAQVSAQTAPLQQTALDQAKAHATQAVAGRYQDFPQVLAALENETATVPQVLEDKLRDAATQQEYDDALDTLYHYLKGKQAGPIAAVVKKASQQDREAERQAQLDATVASATTSPVREEPKTVKDNILEEWTELDAPFANPWSHDQ